MITSGSLLVIQIALSTSYQVAVVGRRLVKRANRLTEIPLHVGCIRTQPEVAQLLKVAKKIVNSTAQKDLLPRLKVGGQWRIKRANLDQWIGNQKATSRGGDSK